MLTESVSLQDKSADATESEVSARAVLQPPCSPQAAYLASRASHRDTWFQVREAPSSDPQPLQPVSLERSGCLGPRPPVRGLHPGLLGKREKLGRPPPREGAAEQARCRLCAPRAVRFLLETSTCRPP